MKVLFLIINLFISCSGGIVGYSVVLWNFPENGILDGEIVPVYIKSNISQVYVIGTENGKTEVPLWALTSPESKRKAEKTFQKYADYNHTFATARRNSPSAGTTFSAWRGLPLFSVA